MFEPLYPRGPRVSRLSLFQPVNFDSLAAYICLHAVEFLFEPLVLRILQFSSEKFYVSAVSLHDISHPRQLLFDERHVSWLDDRVSLHNHILLADFSHDLHGRLQLSGKFIKFAV